MIGRLCTILCGIALTWFCAATGLFLLTGQRCSFATSKHSIARWRVRDVEEALTTYSIARGHCPASRKDLITCGDIGAWSLVDPWGTSIAYWCSSDGMHVSSAGPDRTFGTADDVTN